MSLILEALRKSEAERRRAVVPDLLAEPAVAAPIAATTPQRWPWIAGGRGDRRIARLVRDARPRARADQRDAGGRRARGPATGVRTDHACRHATRRARVAPPDRRRAARACEARADRAKPPRLRPRCRRACEPKPAPAPPPVALDMTERVSDLGSEDRKQLPPLKLSMHMWNDVAAQRFVIIDGTRLRVGDRLGALVVADILPDGVLLDWNGRPLKLPLR